MKKIKTVFSRKFERESDEKKRTRKRKEENCREEGIKDAKDMKIYLTVV